MQGLWKEKLSGWQRKGNKRKKTKRKHIEKEKRKIMRWSDNFMYGRPIQHWYINTWFIGSKRIRQDAKKMINGQTRASVRDWINKGDWEKERDTPCYEKSLAWYIT